MERFEFFGIVEKFCNAENSSSGCKILDTDEFEDVRGKLLRKQRIRKSNAKFRIATGSVQQSLNFVKQRIFEWTQKSTNEYEISNIAEFPRLYANFQVPCEFCRASGKFRKAWWRNFESRGMASSGRAIRNKDELHEGMESWERGGIACRKRMEIWTEDRLEGIWVRRCVAWMRRKEETRCRSRAGRRLFRMIGAAPSATWFSPWPWTGHRPSFRHRCSCCVASKFYLGHRVGVVNTDRVVRFCIAKRFVRESGLTLGRFREDRWIVHREKSFSMITRIRTTTGWGSAWLNGWI